MVHAVAVVAADTAKRMAVELLVVFGASAAETVARAASRLNRDERRRGFEHVAITIFKKKPSI
jgi:hypothetical protein